MILLIVVSAESGEASLGQKFEDAGVDLDNMFKNRQYEHIKTSWLDIFTNKITQVKKDYPFIEKIIYLFILRAGSDFYLVGCSVDMTELTNVQVASNTTDKSVFLDNFISINYGNAKIYKAKKRLELRLRPKKWVDDGFAILFKTDFKQNNIRLYDEALNEEFFQKQFNYINSIKIEII